MYGKAASLKKSKEKPVTVTQDHFEHFKNYKKVWLLEAKCKDMHI